MAVGDFLTWAIQAQDAPAHVGRLLASVLLNEGVVDVAGDSFKVQEDTGSNMQIQIGSGTVGDLVVVEGDDVAGQGVYVHEAQNGTVTRAVAASDPSDDRIDLVVLQNYDDEADSSGNNDAEVEVIEGTPAGSPSAPALPDSAIPLAEVLVGAGVTSITNANITDVRDAAALRDISATRRELSGNQTITDSTVTGISWQSDQKTDDPSGDYTYVHSGGAESRIITFGRAGWYHVEAGVFWDSSATGRRFIEISDSGTSVARTEATPPSAQFGQHVSTLRYFDVDDYTRVQVFQSSSGNLDIINDARTFVAIHRLRG